jgi:hypothetical protein
MSACGGGGGSGGTNGGTSSLPTGGSISNGCSSEGVIFADCLNKDWGALQVFEETLQPAPWVGTVYKQETNTSNVQWKVTDSPAAGRGKVIEVSHGSKSGVGSTLQLRSENTQNRSAYSTGTLTFDLNVVNFGESYNPAKGSALFEMILECVWPCTSHSVFIPVRFQNDWQTVEIKIADLIRDGLDTSKMDTAFMLRPVFEGASQKGVLYQLDNIKWVKGTTSVPRSTEVYAEHFNTNESLNQWVLALYEGGQVNPNKYLAQGLGMYPRWATNFDHWAMETALARPINIRNKKVTFQLKLATALVGGTGFPIGFSVVATDGNARAVESEELTSLGMIGGQWHQFEIQLGSVFPGGFNAADVRKLGIHFYANGKPFYIDGSIHLDTIRITE